MYYFIAFANDAFSLVDEMREAAAKAENLNNFVFEPTSGLYYDQKSGYYYNAVINLSFMILIKFSYSNLYFIGIWFVL